MELAQFHIIEKAINYISKKIKNITLFIFSDDHKWVKENLKSDYKMTYVEHNDAETNYEDLRLMSQCDHNIIANSSFSWWGAWLNDNPNKNVIAPKIWFNDKKMNKDQSILPRNWVKL